MTDMLLRRRTDDQAGAGVPGRRVEVAVMVALLAPRLASSFLPRGSNADFALTATFTIAGDVGLVALVWLVLAFRSDHLSSIGLESPRWIDLGLGAAICWPLWLAVHAVERWASELGASPPQPGALVHADATVVGIAVGVLLVLVVGIVEEVVFRGYFLHRFEDAGMRPWQASMAAGVLFVMGHGYEGGAALVAIIVFTAAMTRLVRWRGSLMSAIVAHVVYDLVAVVLVPALTH